MNEIHFGALVNQFATTAEQAEELVERATRAIDGMLGVAAETGKPGAPTPRPAPQAVGEKLIDSANRIGSALDRLAQQIQRLDNSQTDAPPSPVAERSLRAVRG